jgi:hypothetical protein
LTTNDVLCARWVAALAAISTAAPGRQPRSRTRCGIDQLAAITRTRLKCIQYRPALIDAFIAETGLVIQPQPP